MLTNACKYAIRAVLFLTIQSDEAHKIDVKTLAKSLDVPQPFLAKLLQKLSKNGLVSSTKGPHGGFYMSNNDANNTLWDIINCIDGSDKFSQCFLGLSKCDDTNPCPAHFIVVSFKENLLKDFKEKTIAKYAKQIKHKGQFISLKDFDAFK